MCYINELDLDLDSITLRSNNLAVCDLSNMPVYLCLLLFDVCFHDFSVTCLCFVVFFSVLMHLQM